MSVGVIKDGKAVETAGCAGGRRIIRGDVTLNSNVHLSDSTSFCYAESADRCVAVHFHGIKFDSVNPAPSWTTAGTLPEGIPAPEHEAFACCFGGSGMAIFGVFPNRQVGVYSPQVDMQFNTGSITYIAEPEEA